MLGVDEQKVIFTLTQLVCLEMDEGSALLHHLERKFNNTLTCLATGGGLSKEGLPANNQESICVCGFEPTLLTEIQSHLHKILDRWHDIPRTNFTQHVILTDDFTDDFYSARHVLLCAGVNDCQSPAQLCKIIRAYHYAKQRRANLLLLVHQASEAQNGNANPSNHALDAIYGQNPEIKLLSQKRRLCTIDSYNKTKSFSALESPLHLWLLDKLPDDSDNLEHMDYTDIYQILSRDFHYKFPKLQVFMRLFIMCVLGTVSVLLTLAILIAVSKDTGMSTDIRRARSFLQTYIESQRMGKSEWGWKYNALAITALQTNDPGWCLRHTVNQRSVDRMEISLLAELSRLKPYSRGSTELTPSYLSVYVNGLVATFQNPRDFHDHDLVAVLESYLAQYAPYQKLNSFTLAGYVIALCNAGADLESKYAESLLRAQRNDGSYPLGLDEAAVVVLALSCYPHDPKVRARMTKTVNFLLNQRQYDGSYGPPYTTALVLQAFNESNTPFDKKNYEVSMNWLLHQAKTKSVLKNLDIASQVLITLAGKSMVDVREITGYIRMFTSEQLELPPQDEKGHYTESYRYMKPDVETHVAEPYEDIHHQEAAPLDDVDTGDLAGECPRVVADEDDDEEETCKA